MTDGNAHLSETIKHLDTAMTGSVLIPCAHALHHLVHAVGFPVELDPHVDDEAPTGDTITVYDEGHFVTYLRLLDAKAEGADWREVARIVLHRDPAGDEVRTRLCWESHLARAQWLSREGYRHILEQVVSAGR